MVTRTQLSRLGLFDAKVPRYTSYPTSPQFSADVEETHFRQWIQQVPQGSQVSLYIHVPFCRRLCWFCACRTQGTQSAAPVASYVDTLCAEISLLRNVLPKGVTLSRMHWGGGTPTLLTPDLIDRLASAVAKVLPLGPDAEFSVEIDPNEVDAARLDRLVAAGMNRASIGVQDFNPEIQNTIGRIQPFDTTRDVIDMIRARGVQSLNADILYGLPDQTNARITDTVQKLLSLGPDRVALYGYAHVPWMAKRQRMIPTAALPNADERLGLFETARRLFVWDGYAEVGIDHFALPGDGLAQAGANRTLRRNFQGYTDDQSDVLIGVGASSISRFPQGYAQNAPATSQYVSAIREGRFSVARGHAFRGEDRLRGRIIEAIMCDFAVRSDELCQEFDVSSAQLQGWFEEANRRFENLLDVRPDGLFVPQEARSLTRMIAREFDTYALSHAGHSSAI